MNLALGDFMDQITRYGGVDLHTHTTASDGSCTPRQLLDLAKANDLSVLAVTDHDTIYGISQLIIDAETLQSYTAKHNLTYPQCLAELRARTLKTKPILLTGAELAVLFNRETIHLLAYYAGDDILKLNHFFEAEREKRYLRNKKMLRKLQALGFPIPDHELDPTIEEPSPGRVKVAKWLVRHHYAATIKEAFENYLSEDKPAYIAREKVTLQEALAEIDRTGGFPVIAHPHQYGWCKNAAILRKKLESVPAGYRFGVEVYHAEANSREQKMVKDIAEQMNLVITAGSDFHGLNKEDQHLYSARQNPDNHYRQIL